MGSETRALLAVNLRPRKEPLVVVIGYNPSTARTGHSDRTLTITAKVMHSLGFGRMIMRNLFIKSSPKKDDVNPGCVEEAMDFSECSNELEKADAIVVAWGKDADRCDAAKAAREALKPYASKVFCVAEGDRKPLHPRVWRYSGAYRLAPYML